MTIEEKNEIKEAVLTDIKSESTDIENLESVDTLDGMTSLPALRGTELVRAPLSLLSKKADVAAAAATKAAEQAKEATQGATDATEKAKEATVEATEAAEKANSIAEGIEPVAERIDFALRGATARFGGFLTRDFTEDDYFFSADDVEYPPKNILYSTYRSGFIIQETGEEFVTDWKGSELYNDPDGHALKDKIYIFGTTLYVWDEKAYNLKVLTYRHEVMTETEYEALAEKDDTTIYMILEE